MSDVPELDRILDEHRVFRSNISWEKSERNRIALSRLFLLSLLILFPIIVFGPFGLLALLFLPYFCRLIKIVLPDPARRDPFVRYSRR